MHKLNRPAEEPAVLRTARQRHLQSWDDLSRNNLSKVEIQEKLFQMQEGRCAYCERMLVTRSVHIEHFRKRDQYSSLCFMWGNLFLSCNNKDTCGRYKDSHNINIEQVIDPCMEDPEYFLVFDMQGTICPRSNLNPAEREKAQNTIAAFNLNEIALKRKRKEFLNCVAGFIQKIDAASMLNYLKNKPFITCINQVFNLS